MNLDLVVIAVLAGLANWAFRFLPIRFGSREGREDGPMARFLAATGPAAICTLFVASILPVMLDLPKDAGALASGLISVCAVYGATRSVAGATFVGAAAHAAAFWFLA